MFVEALLREGYVWWRFQNPWRRGGVATHMGLVDAILVDMVCEFASNHIFTNARHPKSEFSGSRNGDIFGTHFWVLPFET